MKSPRALPRALDPAATFARFALVSAFSFACFAGIPSVQAGSITPAQLQTFVRAVQTGDAETVKQSLREVPDFARLRSKTGVTILHTAAGSSVKPSKEVIQALIDAGADLNARDNEGRTPLDVAIAAQRTDLIEFLSKQGATSGKQIAAAP